MVQFLLVCLGGAVGSGLRYLASLTLREGGAVPAFPWDTLVVNVVGSFVIGVLMGLAPETLSTTTRVALAAGVLGGFTTYSTFSYETLRLLHEGAWTPAVAYVLVTLLGSLGATGLGFAAVRAAG